MAVDVLIENARIVDGTGAAARYGGVAVSEGRIAGVGDVSGPAKRVIDADGLTVTPGFFDTHTHYDAQLCWDRLATSSCWHGVTTVLTGNCGYGLAPARPEHVDYLTRLMARVEGMPLNVLQEGVPFEWESFPDYLDFLGRKLGVNVAAQVAHSPLRYFVMGPDSQDRAATDAEISEMQRLLATAMDAGAVGLSTLKAGFQRGVDGRAVPSQKAEPEEVYALGEVLRQKGRGIITVSPFPGASHISPEFRAFLVDLSDKTGRPVIWNQFQHRWDMPDEWRNLLAFMEEAAAKGTNIYAVSKCQSLDLELNLNRTTLFDTFPVWRETLNQPHAAKRRLLADPAHRVKLREEFDAPPAAGAMVNRNLLMRVQNVDLPRNKAAEGRLVLDLAAEAGKHPVDYFLDLALEEDLQTRFLFKGMMNGDPAAVEQIIKSPYCLPGVSDAGAHLDMDCGVDFIALFLRHWVGEVGVMSFEEAIRRLTSMPANLLGLTDRGVLAEGMAADIAMFDADRLDALPRELLPDLPGGAKRIIQRAQGVKAVMVNGEIVIEDGEHTGAWPGRVLPGAN